MIRSAIAHYEIVEQLGEGGMGVVWKARDTHLDRLVAIKMLTSQTVDPGQLSRLVHEARAASALNHPGIVHIYDVGECDGLGYIAMEYVEGKTLEDLIGHRGLRLSDALKHAAHIAHAVAAAHAAGIVHRDLKPANIMIATTGDAKVLDFGLAKLIEPPSQPGSAQTATDQGQGWSGRDTMAGTVPYLSPEQAEGRPLDPRSDIFSFGIILYEMITGINPFRRESRTATVAAILHDEPKPLHDVVPSVPFELERLVTDGRWIYYSSSLAGTVQVWKMPAAGGTPVQVSRAGGFAARESPDGKSLFFTRSEGADSGLWRLAGPGGEETQVLPSVHLHNFEIVSDGIYFMSDATTLKFLDSSGRISTIAAHLPSDYVGLSVSPDRKSILFTVDKPVTSELAMIENFH